jgi:hypothetical protein
MIGALISSRNSLVCTALTVPTVPTGIKIGVLITPLSVIILPARADVVLQVSNNSNFIHCKDKPNFVPNVS